MANVPAVAEKAALERAEGERPNRFRAFAAAVVAGVGVAVAFYRWLRR
jgi:hypothetical protein